MCMRIALIKLMNKKKKTKKSYESKSSLLIVTSF